MKNITMHGATISINGVEISGKHDVLVEFDDTPKVWDVTAPLGWNWTDDDWRMYNFFRDLDSHGGVLSGGLFDRYVLLQYDKQHPAKSLIIFEDVFVGPFTVPKEVIVEETLTTRMLDDDDFMLPSMSVVYRKENRL